MKNAATKRAQSHACLGLAKHKQYRPKANAVLSNTLFIVSILFSPLTIMGGSKFFTLYYSLLTFQAFTPSVSQSTPSATVASNAVELATNDSGST